METKKMYAGCRYKKGCLPDELLKEGGYFTSSKIIKNIIKNQGIKSFEVLRIDTNLDGMNVVDYETLFLDAHNCSCDPDWYNQHNNIVNNFGSTKFKDHSMLLYGVDHTSKSPIVQDKIRQTLLKKYNVDNIAKLSETFKKIRATKLIRYGCENYVNVVKLKQTLIDRYGDNPAPWLTKSNSTCLEKYGDQYYRNPEKQKQTLLDRYGVTNISHLPEIQQKISDGCRDRTLSRFGLTESKQLIDLIVDRANQHNLYTKTGNIKFCVLARYFLEYTGGHINLHQILRKFYKKYA